MTRTRVLITGAAGGVGRACARLFGAAHDLILTDVVPGALDQFTEELSDDGYRVVGSYAGDLGKDAVLDLLMADLAGDAPFTLIHTAGLAPSQGDWREIMRVNLVTSAKLLDRIEPLLRPGSAGVLIASIAGYVLPPMPEIHPALDAPLAADFLDRLAPAVELCARDIGPDGAPAVAYMLSKLGVIRLCEQRAARWGKDGARIVSISPGLIMTPMGRRELANTPGTAEARDAAPAGRPGTPMDIAIAAQFLASDGASFISGCDLRVDGGTTAAQRPTGA